jgi:hypothetical protein
MDLDIADREVVSTYVIRMLSNAGLPAQLAFKGDTAIRKVFLENQGSFSLDLHVAMVGDCNQDGFTLDQVGVLHNNEHYGDRFNIPITKLYVNYYPCGATVTYQHSWVTEGKFSIQFNFREKSILPIKLFPVSNILYPTVNNLATTCNQSQ